MLLSRVHWATHLFWPHTLRKPHDLPKKEPEVHFQCFWANCPSALDGYSFHCFH